MANQIPQRPARLPGEMWGVTTYFNPAGYATKRANLVRFVEGVRAQGLKLLIVELAPTGAAFALEDGLADRVLRVRSDAVLWHKERLLNLGIRQLPEACDKVVWLDGDVLLENADWVARTAALLEQYVVVQPFDTACWLPEGTSWMAQEELVPGIGEGKTLPGMGHAMSRKRDPRSALGNYYQHGHTGFAWAARRALLDRHGLYDALILGGADVIIGRALYSGEEAGHLPYPPALRDHIHAWRQAFHADVGGSVFYTHGRVLHLWHGRLEDRGYEQRIAILADGGFDPRTDIAVDQQGCWTWHSDKPALHRQVDEYFRGRREDG